MPDTVIIPLQKSHFPFDWKILGVRFIDRINLPAKKAGFRNFICLIDGFKNLPEEFVVVYPDILLSTDVWKKIKKNEMEGHSLCRVGESGSCFIVKTKERETILEMLKSMSGSEFLEKSKKHFKVSTVSLEKKDFFLLKESDNLKGVETWLLQGLVKESEGLMSKHFERKISLFVTKNIIESFITPNLMTIFSAMIGLLGAFFFIFHQKWYDFTGSLLFWLHSVLDGCDGEIARLKFLESRWGGILDFWSDNVVHSAVFAAIAYGWSRKTGIHYPLSLGILAVGGTLLSAGLAYWNTMRPKKDSGPLFTSVVLKKDSKKQNLLEKILDFLARRDFIYIVILLSIFGKIEWFLWMGAVGAPIYFFVILFLNVKTVWRKI